MVCFRFKRWKAITILKVELTISMLRTFMAYLRNYVADGFVCSNKFLCVLIANFWPPEMHIRTNHIHNMKHVNMKHNRRLSPSKRLQTHSVIGNGIFSSCSAHYNEHIPTN